MSVQTGHVVNLASDRVTQQSGDGQNFSDQIQYPQYLTGKEQCSTIQPTYKITKHITSIMCGKEVVDRESQLC